MQKEWGRRRGEAEERVLSADSPVELCLSASRPRRPGCRRCAASGRPCGVTRLTLCAPLGGKVKMLGASSCQVATVLTRVTDGAAYPARYRRGDSGPNRPSEIGGTRPEHEEGADEQVHGNGGGARLHLGNAGLAGAQPLRELDLRRSEERRGGKEGRS